MNDERKQIRLKVVGIFRNGDRILMIHVVDPTNGRLVYVPPGGGVEFGEDTETAVRREMREELNTELEDVALLGVIENRFTFAGKSAHEIVFVYGARFPDRARYDAEALEITERDGTKFRATWVDFVTPGPQSPPLCPDGLVALLKRTLNVAPGLAPAVVAPPAA